MCMACNMLTEQGNDLLNELIDLRRSEDGYNEESPTRPEMMTANALRESVDLEEARQSPDVGNLCLALAVAVERLAALERSVTS